MGEQVGHAALPLLERERELTELRHAVDAAAAGEGRAVLIEGPAGAGKTRLLRAARWQASEAHFRVLSARGEEYERDFPFGLARQLFEPVLREIGTESELLAGPAGAPARLALGLAGPGEPLPDPAGAARLALYTLIARLAKGAPVLITIDDVHWGDLASLRWLTYLIRRLSDQPTAVVATVGAGAAADEVTMPLRAVATESGVVTLRPGPLSRAAVESLVETAFARPGDEPFVDAVHEATGGNPFLVHELLATIQSEGLKPIDDVATQVGARAPERVANSAVARVRRLGPDAVEAARAVAVFGEASVRQVALLTGIDHEAAAVAADALAAADIFVAGRRLQFRHGLIRTAVYSAMTLGARDAAHHRAAKIVAGADELERAAGHLLAVEPHGSAWIVAILRRSASAATGRGAPEAAVAYLRRALSEPPAADELSQVLLALGAAEEQTGDPASVDHFSRAMKLAESDVERARAGRELGRALTHLGRFDEALTVLERAGSEAGAANPGLALELETLLLNAEQFEPRAPRDLRARRASRARQVPRVSRDRRAIPDHKDPQGLRLPQARIV